MSPDFSIFFYIAHFLRFELSLNKFHLNNICNVIRKNNKKSRKSLIFGENGVLNFTFFVKLSHMATFVSWFSSFEAKSKARNYLTFTWNHIWSIENIEKPKVFSNFDYDTWKTYWFQSFLHCYILSSTPTLNWSCVEPLIELRTAFGWRWLVVLALIYFDWFWRLLLGDASKYPLEWYSI